jgi:hypothetical protein
LKLNSSFNKILIIVQTLQTSKKEVKRKAAKNLSLLKRDTVHHFVFLSFIPAPIKKGANEMK